MKCPSCKDDKNLAMTERMGIEIDYCPDCRGVWLDRGELDKIIEKSRTENQTNHSSQKETNQQVSYRDSNNDHKDYYKHKRKKSLLEELFD